VTSGPPAAVVASVVLVPPAAVAAMELRLLEATAVALAVATVAVLALRAGGKSHRRQQPSGRSSPRFIRSLARSSFSSPAGTTFIFNCLFSATRFLSKFSFLLFRLDLKTPDNISHLSTSIDLLQRFVFFFSVLFITRNTALPARIITQQPIR
jgi:hypothetical protein